MALFWLALYGTYVNWGSTLLAAMFGTSRRTPIAGSLISLSVAIVAACVLALRGLGRTDAEAG